MRERALEGAHTLPQVHELPQGAVRAFPRRLRGEGPWLQETDQSETQYTPGKLPPQPQPPLHGAYLVFQSFKALEQVVHGGSSSVASIGGRVSCERDAGEAHARSSIGVSVAGSDEGVNPWGLPSA